MFAVLRVDSSGIRRSNRVVVLAPLLDDDGGVLQAVGEEDEQFRVALDTTFTTDPTFKCFWSCKGKASLILGPGKLFLVRY